MSTPQALRDQADLLNVENLGWIKEETRPDVQDILLDMADLFKEVEIKTATDKKICGQAVKALSSLLNGLPDLAISAESKLLLLLSALECSVAVSRKNPVYKKKIVSSGSSVRFILDGAASSSVQTQAIELFEHLMPPVAPKSSRKKPSLVNIQVPLLKEPCKKKSVHERTSPPQCPVTQSCLRGEAAFITRKDEIYFAHILPRFYKRFALLESPSTSIKPFTDLMLRFVKDGLATAAPLRVHYATRVLARLIEDRFVAPESLGSAISDEAFQAYYATLKQLKAYIPRASPRDIGPKALFMALAARGYSSGFKPVPSPRNKYQINYDRKSLIPSAINAISEIEQESHDRAYLLGPFKLVRRAIKQSLSDDFSSCRQQLPALAERLDKIAFLAVNKDLPDLADLSLSCLALLIHNNLILPTQISHATSENFIVSAFKISEKVSSLSLIAEDRVMRGASEFLYALQEKGYAIQNERLRGAAVLSSVQKSPFHSFRHLAPRQNSSRYLPKAAPTIKLRRDS